MIPAKREAELREAVQGGTLFTIDAEDMSFIFNILRNNMYSDPIKVLIQEYACNGRDAHRECGKSAVPLRVSLPNVEDRRFIVRDFGKGMDYNTMVNVFCKYGKSTKRGTNQTGGFGIGAKSAWAYRDDFNVNVYQNGRVYSYEFFIDESQCGMMNLIDIDDTDQEDGTEIIVKVEESDVDDFRTKYKNLTAFWGIRPIVEDSYGFEYFELQDHMIAYEGENFIVFKTNNEVSNKAFVLVDSVPYPINLESLKLGDASLRTLAGKPLMLRASMSDVDVAASREQLNYTEKTIQWIHNELQSIYDQLDQWTRLEINTYENLWEARCNYKHASGIFRWIKDLGFKDLMWRELPIKCKTDIPKDDDRHPDDILQVILCKEYQDYRTYVTRVGSENVTEISWDKSRPIMITNSRRVPRAKATAVINDENHKWGKHLDGVQIIMLPKNPDLAKKDLEALEKLFHLSHLNPINADDVQTRKVKKQFTNKKRGETAVTIGEWTRTCNGRPDKQEVILEDLEGYFLFTNHSSMTDYKGEEHKISHYHDTLKYLADFHGVRTIHLIPQRFEKKVKNNFSLQSFWDFKRIQDGTISKAAVTRAMKKSAKKGVTMSGKWSYLRDHFTHDDFKKGISKDSPFRKYIDMFNTGTSLTEEEQKLCSYARHLDGYKVKTYSSFKDTVNEEHQKITQRYKLLKVMDDYDIRYMKTETVIEHLVIYINAVDAM
jgi:hypothetical protein